MARLVESVRGRFILEHEGYSYHKHSTNRNQTRTYWRCEKRDICNGSLSTNFNINDGIQDLKTGKAHTHEVNPVDIEVKNVVRAIKRKAVEHPNVPPSALYREEVVQVRNEEVLMSLPERNDIIRTINRVQNRHRPRNPVSLEDLEIVAPYTTTLNGQDFLQFDSRDQNRIVIFYTLDALTKLCNSRNIFCDGTFKTVPNMFFRLYTIHGTVNGYVFPMVYVLATRKTEETYYTIFNHLKEHAARLGQEFNPQYIVSDFELGFLNVARQLWPQSTVHGCLFHFTQAIWRYAVNLGLKVQFNQDQEVRTSIQMLLALPFVPLADLITVFDSISEEVPDDVVDLVNYIDATYVRGRAARGRRRATAPRFAPPLWNVYELVLNKMQRSNNVCEGWHSRFSKSNHKSSFRSMEVH